MSGPWTEPATEPGDPLPHCVPGGGTGLRRAMGALNWAKNRSSPRIGKHQQPGRRRGGVGISVGIPRGPTRWTPPLPGSSSRPPSIRPRLQNVERFVLPRMDVRRRFPPAGRTMVSTRVLQTSPRTTHTRSPLWRQKEGSQRGRHGNAEAVGYGVIRVGHPDMWESLVIVKSRVRE